MRNQFENNSVQSENNIVQSGNYNVQFENNRENCVIRKLNFLLLVVLAVATVSGFTSCSSGTGADNTPNLDDESQRGGGLTYSGPPAATSDVQSFQVNVWNNLVADNRCGGCHRQGGTGEGFFVRDDDINRAYSAAITITNLSNPANSRMVTKVAGAHNCWLADPNACADIISGWITAWANSAGGVANVITLTTPAFNPVQDSRNFPADSSRFEDTVYELVRGRGNCLRCHSEGADNPQMPFFASADVSTAYSAAQSRIDLADYERANATPREQTRSRFIVRLRNEGHNCWSESCASDAQEMEDAILLFAGGLSVTEVDPNLLTSGAVALTVDGIVASAGGRIENDVIALYTFKPPTSGDVGEDISEVFDVSGVEPAANLRAFGSDVTWVGGWGARINSGRLQGSASKLFDLITLTGEYSIETWVVPGNVEQDNFARIVAYTGGALTGNNFAMAQSAYNYNFLHRNSSTTNQDGMPAYSTADADEVLQATQQHAVMTYDPINGRQIFVNGENVVAGGDPQAGGNFSSWDRSFALSLGQNAGGGDQWQGTLRLLAIHNRALSPEEIGNNFAVGVGEKFYLLFDLSRTTPALVSSIPQAFIGFEVEQFDSYGYLFKNPFFISLDSDAVPSSPIRIRGMRIGLNGRELNVGQAYAKLDVTVDSSSYSPTGQTLSTFGTIIPLENGPDNDQFFLTFDQIGSSLYSRPAPPAPPPLVPTSSAEAQSRIAVRNFEEINAALAQMTGIPKGNSAVRGVYNTVRQQLPQDEAIDGFLPAHQMGVTQLVISYCDQLATNAEGNRAAYFAGFSGWGDNNVGTVFGAPGSANRSAIIDPILESMAAHTFDANGTLLAGHLTTQPNPGDVFPGTYDSPPDVTDELNDLIDRMIAGTDPANPGASSTEEIVTSVCAAAMGSAILMIQ
ncbi:MAG: LamG domain-containing protein [Cellvibrionaceae bacterium]